MKSRKRFFSPWIDQIFTFYIIFPPLSIPPFNFIIITTKKLPPLCWWWDCCPSRVLPSLPPHSPPPHPPSPPALSIVTLFYLFFSPLTLPLKSRDAPILGVSESNVANTSDDESKWETNKKKQKQQTQRRLLYLIYILFTSDEKRNNSKNDHLFDLKTQNLKNSQNTKNYKKKPTSAIKTFLRMTRRD